VPVVPDILESVLGQFVDDGHVWLVMGAVWILVRTLICVTVERRWLLGCIRSYLIAIDPYLSVFDTGLKLVKLLGRVVRRYSGLESIVPMMKATDEVLADERAVGEKSAAMHASAIEN